MAILNNFLADDAAKRAAVLARSGSSIPIDPDTGTEPGLPGTDKAKERVCVSKCKSQYPALDARYLACLKACKGDPREVPGIDVIKTPVCTSDAECVQRMGMGYKCVDGNCKKTEIFKTCLGDADCPEGQKCKDGKCDGGITTQCGKGVVTSGSYPTGKTVEGCECSAAYRPNVDGQCNPGYHWVDGPAEDKRCECDKNTGDGTTTGTLGEFEWSGELSGLMKKLRDRANWLIDNPGGMTEAERSAIKARAFEESKAQERPALQSNKDALSRMGMLGSGLEFSSENAIRRDTGKNLAGIQRDIVISEEQRKIDDMLKTTGAASTLTGQSTTFEQLLEMINASRRGEGREDYSLLLQYLSMLYGNNNDSYSSYWQSILNQM